MNLCNLTSFFDHAFCVYCCRFDFSDDWSVYDGCNLCDYFFKYTSFFGDQGWICCNSTDHTHVICFFNILYICCVNKKFHCLSLLKIFVDLL